MKIRDCEVLEAKGIVKDTFQKRFGRIYSTDIVLLESSFNGKRIDYILFRNSFTNRCYKIRFDNDHYRYEIEEEE